MLEVCVASVLLMMLAEHLSGNRVLYRVLFTYIYAVDFGVET